MDHGGNDMSKNGGKSSKKHPQKRESRSNLVHVIPLLRVARMNRLATRMLHLIADLSDAHGILIAKEKNGPEQQLLVMLEWRDRAPISLCPCHGPCHAFESMPVEPKTSDDFERWWDEYCSSNEGSRIDVQLLTFLDLAFPQSAQRKKATLRKLWHAIHDPFPEELVMERLRQQNASVNVG